MTHSEKIGKLARAIRDYRGAYNEQTGKWLPNRTPNPSARVRVEKWLTRISLSIGEMARIDAFKTQEQFRLWLNTL